MSPWSRWSLPWLLVAMAAPLASLLPLAAHGQAGEGPQNAASVTRVPRAETMYGVPSAPDLSTLKADVVFLGVPYDLGNNSVPGTRLGPAAIRHQAADIAGPSGADGFYDRETGQPFMQGVRVVDAGNVVIPNANVAQSLTNVTSAIAAIVASGALPVTIGGDHSITFAVLRGFEKSGKKIHVIHLDSHQDFGPVNDRGTGQPVIHYGNHLRHAIALPWITGISMLGLRGLTHGNGATAEDVRASNVTMLSASEVVKMGAAAAAARISAADDYYVTIDIDVLDPAIAPATGTPVPGGLSYYQMCDLLDAFAAKGRIIGFDITEVSPPSDVNDQTSRLAAYIGLRFLESIYKHRR